AVTVFGSGSSYTASYTVQAGDSGPAGVIISDFADQAGNAGSTVSATTDASSVTMDTTAPTLDTVTIASNNAIASLARAGNIINVSITASEAISPPTVTIAGNAATVTGSGAIYTASYMVQLMDTGAAAIVITDIADLAGNVGSSVSATTNSSSVTMDTTPPTINFRNPGSGATIVSLDSIVVTFNEAVTNLNAGQLSVNGSPATSVTGSNPFTFSGFATPNFGTVNVALIAGNTRDVVGNAFVGNSWSYQAEAVSLTITSTMAEDSVLRSQFQTLTFTFAKPVAGFNSGMVAVTGASKGTFTGSGSVYTLLLDNSGGLNEVEVAAKFPPDFPGLATFSNFYQDIWPITLPGGVRMDLYRIPAGSFMMGSPESEPGRGTNENQFEASFSQDFYMAKTLVTRQQWEALQSLPAPQSFTGPPTLPVHNVSHNDIQSWLVAFNNHITEPSAFGLPTEAQWEYVARAGTTTRFYFGDGISAIDDECALGGEREDNMWFCGNTSSLMAVGTKGPNPWGLDDMHGNLSEWVRDWFAPYPEEPMTNRFISQLVPYPLAPGIDIIYPFRMVRGGAWNSHARACRSAHRVSKSPETRDSNTGFRIIGVR
ncbi:MAG: SUMF1/EgtB/PvdO family nonheme iron enzyme, partial [Candidatus Sumerlaeia bacterium]|nr:SUMF1/EgtB/PvdO family nonheme iron enzyme [Candidatus Sumerlaeia bacterium]